MTLPQLGDSAPPTNRTDQPDEHLSDSGAGYELPSGLVVRSPEIAVRLALTDHLLAVGIEGVIQS